MIRGPELLVAIDVGTSGARAVAIDDAGVPHIEIRRTYETLVERPGWAEQSALRWRDAALDALGGLVAQLRPTERTRIRAIGLTGQCPSVVLLDARGRPTRLGLTYRDNRAVAEARQLAQRYGETALHARTGHRPAAFHIAPKLLWVRAHEPVVFRSTTLVLQPRDWIGLVLTGEVSTDGTHAAATLLFDLAARRWDMELLDDLELPASLLPPVREPTAVLGTLRHPIAERVGLPAATPVVLGAADSQACAFGAGVVGPGPVSEMAGSSSCLNAVVATPLASLDVTHYPYVMPGALCTETGINTTGSAVAWVVGSLYRRRQSLDPLDAEARHELASPYDALDVEAAAVPPGSEGAVALPVLADGDRTDPTLRGVIAGLTPQHGRGAIARAILEGIAFAVRDQIQLLVDGGVDVAELRVSGGGSRLATLNRIKADVLGVPVTVLPGDAAVSGVAMLTGLGTGRYRDTVEAIARVAHPEQPIEPDPSTADAYAEAHAVYGALLASAAARPEERSTG